MAKQGSIEKNNRRKRLVKQAEGRRSALKKIISTKDAPIEDRIMATLKLAEMPRNSSRTRVRNRCLLTGRPRGYHRKFSLSRIALRDLGSAGLIPGIIKSSW
ncbi:MAG: 30S ribosomal protein S14 [Alphaproteobacteria bacterium]|jgi:small subunit ribosomal protein S14|nr:30S ribosomal protein S14 [Alphaproteobacteria bacterium]